VVVIVWISIVNSMSTQCNVLVGGVCIVRIVLEFAIAGFVILAFRGILILLLALDCRIDVKAERQQVGRSSIGEERRRRSRPASFSSETVV